LRKTFGFGPLVGRTVASFWPRELLANSELGRTRGLPARTSRDQRQGKATQLAANRLVSFLPVPGWTLVLCGIDPVQPPEMLPRSPAAAIDTSSPARPSRYHERVVSIPSPTASASVILPNRISPPSAEHLLGRVARLCRGRRIWRLPFRHRHETRSHARLHRHLAAPRRAPRPARYLHDGNRTIGPASRRTGLGLPASSTATKVKVASVTFSR
jgi:hypothetical protein